MATDDEGHHADEKYVVFKADEWAEFYQFCFGRMKADDEGLQLTPPVLHDAVVIRTRDVFAHAGLMAYAGVVQVAVELAEMQGLKMVGGVPLSRLREISDYFHDRAHDAATKTHRVPD